MRLRQHPTPRRETVESTMASESDTSSSPDSSDSTGSASSELDFSLIDQLIAVKDRTTGTDSALKRMDRDIGHAPLLSDDIVTSQSKDLVPQCAFLGTFKEDSDASVTRIFQNTNEPFSTFICGVQGSGKSHTTAVMLENALVASDHLGRLREPVSALVFSYGDFSIGGLGFNISEAAFLAAEKEGFKDHEVKKLTVLRSASNRAIETYYRRFPKVEIIPFKINAQALDVGTLLTLMAVDDKVEVPLYMAKIESILRDIATKSKTGIFDYKLFKKKLEAANFDQHQKRMLDQRLSLLESFLDVAGQAPEPQFRQGEITIVDLSDPMVTASTACILFKLCLGRFMQSSAPGKMVVLDEAHKYMLDNPGSLVLTEYLKTLIRLQRHKGARVIVSTQEPTVSTDLIALCSTTIIHRFTSPAWYAALKKHINAMDDDKAIMEQIEGLETGEALIYSPTAVLGKNDDGTLEKATGRLLKLNIRMRVTSDGGESVMAV
ncbi:hypothetical protein N0V83_000760 [Neocucurbitaria cava]|uniref:Zona occludens toxin N-terminal domain-containing protein n=1 Tax=Neocucurbitaria cava TaxID=798079 RepID=A0A9W9CRE7_9PLEO|nr:hypothetical protein N0V83_000760 [Neocucurbitaria cava]